MKASDSWLENKCVVMEAIINKEEIQSLLTHFTSTDNGDTAIKTSSRKTIPEYEQAIAHFVDHCQKNKWILDDYHLITDSWTTISDKLSHISQLNQEDCLRLVSWYIRGDKLTKGLLMLACKKEYLQAILKRLLEL